MASEALLPLLAPSPDGDDLLLLQDDNVLGGGGGGGASNEEEERVWTRSHFVYMLRDENVVLLVTTVFWMVFNATMLLIMWTERLRAASERSKLRRKNRKKAMENVRLLDFASVTFALVVAIIGAGDLASDCAYLATLVREAKNENGTYSKWLAIPSGIVLFLPMLLSVTLFWLELTYVSGQNTCLLTKMRERGELRVLDWIAMDMLPAFTPEVIVFLPWHASDATATTDEVTWSPDDEGGLKITRRSTIQTIRSVITRRSTVPFATPATTMAGNTRREAIKALNDSLEVSARLNMPSSWFFWSIMRIQVTEDALQLILSLLYTFLTGNVTAASAAIFSVANLLALYVAPFVAARIKIFMDDTPQVAGSGLTITTKKTTFAPPEEEANTGLLPRLMFEMGTLRRERDEARAFARALRHQLRASRVQQETDDDEDSSSDSEEGDDDDDETSEAESQQEDAMGELELETRIAVPK